MSRLWAAAQPVQPVALSLKVYPLLQAGEPRIRAEAQHRVAGFDREALDLPETGDSFFGSSQVERLAPYDSSTEGQAPLHARSRRDL